MLGNVAQLWGIIGELNLNELEQDLCRRVVLRLVASEQSLLDLMADVLQRQPTSLVETVLLPEGVSEGKADLEVLVLPGGRSPSAHESAYARSAMARGSLLLVARVTEGGAAPARDDGVLELLEVPPEHQLVLSFGRREEGLDQLVEMLGQAAPHLRLALARQTPALRRPTAQRLIRETSAANAQFALVSSVPSLIPLVGGFVGGLADSIVLTKNQALLLFKLAGLHGRDLSDKTRLMGEILPVVGGAFFWRSLARSLVGLLPAIVSAAPKVGVAYVGTFVVGEMADYYYRSGRRPSGETVGRFKEDGARVFRSVAERILSRGAESSQDVEAPERGP